MINKTPDNDFLPIKEFAALVGMSVATLRYYDKIGIFRPARRGVEFSNKYRYYSPTQITTIKMIRVLTEIGVSLDTIKELAEDRTPEKLLKLLSKHRDKTAVKLHFLEEVYSVISTFQELLFAGVSATEDDISVSQMPEKQIVLGAVNEYGGSVGFYREFTRFCNVPHVPRLNLSYPIGGYFESMDAFLNEPSLPTRFFSLDPSGHEKKDAGPYLTGYTRGYYGQTNDLPERMVAFARKNGLVFTGHVYNLYLFDETSTIDTERYLLQVSASVRETRRMYASQPDLLL